MAGGGVASPYNPIEFTQFTEPEIRAAVEATENWGTYVTVHVKMATAYNGELMAGRSLYSCASLSPTAADVHPGIV